MPSTMQLPSAFFRNKAVPDAQEMLFPCASSVGKGSFWQYVRTLPLSRSFSIACKPQSATSTFFQAHHTRGAIHSMPRERSQRPGTTRTCTKAFAGNEQNVCPQATNCYLSMIYCPSTPHPPWHPKQAAREAVTLCSVQEPGPQVMLFPCIPDLHEGHSSMWHIQSRAEPHAPQCQLVGNAQHLLGSKQAWTRA